MTTPISATTGVAPASTGTPASPSTGQFVTEDFGRFQQTAGAGGVPAPQMPDFSQGPVDKVVSGAMNAGKKLGSLVGLCDSPEKEKEKQANGFINQQIDNLRSQFEDQEKKLRNVNG